MDNLLTALIVVPIIAALLTQYYIIILDRRDPEAKLRRDYLIAHIYVLLVYLAFSFATTYYVWWVWPSNSIPARAFAVVVALLSWTGTVGTLVRVALLLRPGMMASKSQ